MNKKKLLKRAEWVCQVYNDYFMSIKSDIARRQEAKELEFTDSLTNSTGPKLGGDVA